MEFANGGRMLDCVVQEKMVFVISIDFFDSETGQGLFPRSILLVRIIKRLLEEQI